MSLALGIGTEVKANAGQGRFAALKAIEPLDPPEGMRSS